MADPVFRSMERRMSDSALAWLATLPALNGFPAKGRDEDALLEAPTEAPQPVLIVVAEDQGRFIKRAPIRNVRLKFFYRANEKQGGDKDVFATLGGAIENALDSTNLQTALTNSEVVVMLAVRVSGTSIRRSNLVREGCVEVECKCVAMEMTTN